MLSYFGQGAVVLSDASAIDNPFYRTVPQGYLLPMVGLATLATIIASQATITGAFSLTRQAIQLRLLPRMTIRHTSGEHAGQIYLPAVNWLMMAGVLTIVWNFQNSTELAAAYGIAVTGTMIVTATLAILMMAWHWKWSRLRIALVMAPFLALELVFLSSTADGSRCSWAPACSQSCSCGGEDRGFCWPRPGAASCRSPISWRASKDRA
jgi:KUP system potassium uptake protein